MLCGLSLTCRASLHVHYLHLYAMDGGGTGSIDDGLCPQKALLSSSNDRRKSLAWHASRIAKAET